MAKNPNAPWEDAPIVANSVDEMPWESAPIVQDVAPPPAKRHGASGSWAPKATLTDALFGRTKKASKATKGLGALSDISSDALLTLPALVGYLGGKTAWGSDTPSNWRPEKNARFADILLSLKEGKAPNTGKSTFVTQTGADPAVLPSMAVGGPMAQIASKVPALAAKVPTIAAKVPALAAKAGKAAAVGAGEGAVSAGFHAADDAAQGRGASGGKAALEVGINAAIPGLASAAGAGLRNTAKKIMTSYLKPGVKARGQGYNVDHLFGYGLAGNLKKMAEKTDILREKAARDVDIAVTHQPGQTVDVLPILSQVETDMIAEAKKRGKYSPEAITKAIEGYQELINEFADPQTGQVSIEQLHGLKQRLQQDAEGLYRAAQMGTDLKATESAAVAKTLAAKLRQQVEKLAPAVIGPNKTLSETKGIDTAIKDAVRRTEKNNAISLTDLLALGIGVPAGGLVASEDNPISGGSLGGVTLLALNRASKDPRFASALYRTGGILGNPGPRSQALRALLYRPAMTGAFSEGSRNQ